MRHQQVLFGQCRQVNWQYPSIVNRFSICSVHCGVCLLVYSCCSFYSFLYLPLRAKVVRSVGILIFFCFLHHWHTCRLFECRLPRAILRATCRHNSAIGKQHGHHFLNTFVCSIYIKKPLPLFLTKAHLRPVNHLPPTPLPPHPPPSFLNIQHSSWPVNNQMT